MELVQLELCREQEGNTCNKTRVQVAKASPEGGLPNSYPGQTVTVTLQLLPELALNV